MCCLLMDVFRKVFSCSNLIYIYGNIQVKVFTVLAFSQEILTLGLKIRTFPKSEFPGLLKNIIPFNPRWLKGQVVLVHTYYKGFFIVIKNKPPL